MTQLSQADFTARLDVWIANAVGDKQPSFRQLLNSLPGVYPSEALKALHRLTARGLIPEEYEALIIKEAKTPQHEKVMTTTRMSDLEQMEHPLDFEWRFTRNALETLCKKMQELCFGHPATALCLGCPSVYTFGREQLPSCNFVLIDKNASAEGQLSESRSLLKFDLVHELIPAIRAEIAIIDPPWYNDYYKLFVWAALQNLKPNGYIILSFPPAGTRPSARDDLSHVVNWCSGVGIQLEEHLESQLPYRSPLFEVNALKAENLYGVPLNWRRGDLLVLKLIEKVIVPRPSIPEISANWIENRFGLVRIKIREDLRFLNTHLTPVGNSAVLASVSSRHPDRANANIVTSGNRFLQTEFPRELTALCREFDGEIKNFQSNGNANNFLRNELINLIKLEQAEAFQYLANINDL